MVNNVIEIDESSRDTVSDMVAKVVAMQEEAKVNKETELKRAEQRLRAKEKSHASFNKRLLTAYFEQKELHDKEQEQKMLEQTHGAR